jgi:aminoglycoside phosphotransferase (APT) family kinase protein
MDSITKPKITEDQLAAICKEHLCDRLEVGEELKDGWFNTAFLLKTAAGREAVIKVAPLDSVRLMRYEENLMHAEVAALRLVKHMTAVPVPTVIAYDKSRDIVESDFFLTDRIPGRPMNQIRESLDVAAKTKIDQRIGAYLKELHGIQGHPFGTFNRQEFATWPEAFACMMDWLDQDARDLKVELPHKVFDIYRRFDWALEEATTPTLVHWDLWDGNIFVDLESGAVTGFIDFERALWADPVIEVNFSNLKPGFLEAYGSAIMSTHGAKTRRLLYDLYLYLIMVIECRFRRFASDHEAWTRSQLDKTLSAIAGL